MRFAIPLADGKLAVHFGHCASFALLDVDPEGKSVMIREDVEAPPHQPGLLPPWLAERGVNRIIAGGMGQRAQALFAEHGIEVIVGAPIEAPETLVAHCIAGTLVPVSAVDIGLAQLAMHAAVEVMGAEDYPRLIAAMRQFYKE